jgi:DMSO/TMAO reductase YedYZ molybdopterin-dependent catalytic subunit
MESREEFVTLRCVGESLNGRKTDTALWTVVDVAPLLERAGAPDDCCVMLRAADGYFVQFPRTALETGMLAYGMNGRDLPRGHGAPVRALIPGHWGEVNTKWLSEIEVIDEPVDGYWEQRGWHGTGPVNTMAKLHVTNLLSDGRVEVAGHTYAGTRGIERVEVSTDGGETWTDAELSEPLPGEDVWRQWVHRYEPPDEAHEVVVRAVDGEGTLQTREESGAFPSGPTGWVSQTVRP